MHKPSIGLSLEGMPFIFLTTVATLTFALIGCSAKDRKSVV